MFAAVTTATATAGQMVLASRFLSNGGAVDQTYLDSVTARRPSEILFSTQQTRFGDPYVVRSSSGSPSRGSGQSGQAPPPAGGSGGGDGPKRKKKFGDRGWHGETNPSRGFQDVDVSSIPEYYADYLRFQYGVPFFREYKAKSYSWLPLEKGKRALEIGCGLGLDAEEMARSVGATGQVVGIDSSDAMVSMAMQRTRDLGLSLQFLKMNAADLDFEDNSFDLCRIDRVLQHIREPENVIREILRVLKSGGRVVCIDPDWGTLAIGCKNMSVAKRCLDHWRDSFSSGLIGRNLPRLLREAGFTNLRSSGETMIIEDYQTADKMYAIEQNANEAAQKGVVTEKERDEWLDELRGLARSGQFFSSLTFFMVYGEKK